MTKITLTPIRGNPKRNMFTLTKTFLENPQGWTLNSKLGLRYSMGDMGNYDLYLGKHPWLELKLLKPARFHFTLWQRIQLSRAAKKIQHQLLLKQATKRFLLSPRLEIPKGVKLQNN